MTTRMAVAVLSAVLTAVGARMTAQETGKEVLLEVVQTTYDSRRAETLVYIRVYADGQGEAHPTQEVDFRKIGLVRKNIPVEEFEQLIGILNDKTTAELDSHYERFWGGKSRTEWQVSLVENGRTRSINLVNFRPFLARQRRQSYPRQLEKLGCMIWLLRSRVVTAEGVDEQFFPGCAAVIPPNTRK